MPSAEWREVFMKRFKNFRKNSAQPPSYIDGPTEPISSSTLPDRKDRDAWWSFLSGRPEIEWNPPRKPKAPTARQQRQMKYGRGMRGYAGDEWTPVEPPQDISYEDNHAQIKAEASSGSLPTPFGTPGPTEEGEVSVDGDAPLKFAQREPTPSLVSKIDHRYALHLLMYFTHWINLSLEQPHPRPNHINESHARWIFILLSRVEDYVSADEMSLLRNLARACMALLRDNLRDPLARSVDGELERMSTRSCWFVIEIIVDHWAQRDLWMDAETMLTTIVP